MNYKEYRDLSFEQRVKLAKKILLRYFSMILNSYSYEEVNESELKKEIPHAKKDLEGVCDYDERMVLINKRTNHGFNILRTLLHEGIETLLGDKDLFNCDMLRKGKKEYFQVDHDKIDEIAEKIIRSKLLS